MEFYLRDRATNPLVEFRIDNAGVLQGTTNNLSLTTKNTFNLKSNIFTLSNDKDIPFQVVMDDSKKVVYYGLSGGDDNGSLYLTNTSRTAQQGATLQGNVSSDARTTALVVNESNTKLLSWKQGTTTNNAPLLGVSTPVEAADTSKNITESDLPYQAANKQYVEDTSNNVKSYVNNNFANALKGSASGEAVRLTDVSPIEHEIKIKLTTESNYSDFSGVTLKRYGKNLLPYPYFDTTKTVNGITFTDNGDGSVTISGTASDNAYFYLQRNADYGTQQINAIDKNSANNGVYTASSRIYYNAVNKTVTININPGTTLNETVYPQVELGVKATDYEAYLPPIEYTPSSDGTVTGVSADSEDITLMTDTAGVAVNAEYNKDINKVISELYALVNG